MVICFYGRPRDNKRHGGPALHRAGHHCTLQPGSRGGCADITTYYSDGDCSRVELEGAVSDNSLIINSAQNERL